MMRNGSKGTAGLALILAVAAGCAEERAGSATTAEIGQTRSGLDAICTVQVEDIGAVDVEEDYVAHVVHCENGAADFQALKAQAVAARSYMYYKVETSGEIGDGQHDQVYSCGRGGPGPEHYRAARETAGQVLMYADTVVAAFYVAGSIPEPPECVATAADRDPTNTERFVTYNEGRSGDDLMQTPLGWVNPANVRNRGCKSQNGANCLSRTGWDYRDILRFYYGADIELVQAVGPCVPDVAPPPDMGPDVDAEMRPDADPVADAGPIVDAGPPRQDAAPPPVDRGPPPTDCPTAGGSPAVVDDSSGCFTFGCASGEWGVGVARGFNGGMLQAPTIDADANDCVGRWTGAVSADGLYDLSVYIEPGARVLSRSARYVVQTAEGEFSVRIDQRDVDGWASLGRFRFDADMPITVTLGDATGEPFAPDGPRVAFDALQISRADDDTDGRVGVDGGVPDAGPPGGGGDHDEAEGCAAAPGPAAPSWPWLLVGLGGVLWRRRGRTRGVAEDENVRELAG